MEPFVATNAPRYPQRTVVQLRELTDDIKEITGMSDHQANEQQKVDLYLKHYDAITEVTQTFDEHWEDFTTEWPVRLEERLLENGWTDLDE